MSSAALIDSTGCKLLFSDAVASESAGILLRSRLQSVARRMGFPEARRENLILVASEMVTNLIKHAQGRGALQIWQQPHRALDLLSFDYGPGVADPGLAQQDGYSTKGTLGKGLGSMRRLSDRFGMYSRRARPGHDQHWHGTAVWCRFYVEPPQEAPGRWEAGLFVRSLANDRHNGDHIYLDAREGSLRLFHLDGLGHGLEAEQATAQLGRYVTGATSLSELVASVDRHLRATPRGAVAVACELDAASRRLRLLGVGDMAAKVCQGEGAQGFTFAPGVLGREHKTPHPAEVDLERGALLVTTSDGIRRGWDASSFPGLCNQHPQLVAYVIGNAMARITDDQSVCAVRIT